MGVEEKGKNVEQKVKQPVQEFEIKNLWAKIIESQGQGDGVRMKLNEIILYQQRSTGSNFGNRSSI